MEEVFNAASELIRNTGHWIADSRSKYGFGEIELKGANDFVTEMDLASEKRLVEGLKPLLENAGFLTEEKSIDWEDGAEWRWIIDPIDGTTNFIYGLPCYAISVALEKIVHNKAGSPAEPELVWGMVYEVSRDEAFTAIKGGGACLNSRPIYTRASTGLSDSLIATGFPYTQFSWMPAYLNVLSEVLEASNGVRRFGSAAIDLSYVAAGRFSGYFEYNLNPWDVAAGVLLVREAGGVVETFSGKGNPVHDRSLVCGNTAVVGEIQEIIKRRF